MSVSKSMKTVTVDGGELAVAHWPGDGPTLLLVHGISASHCNWLPIIDALPAGHYNILAPDLRGRGASSALPGPYGLARHVDDLRCVIDQLASAPVAYAGHSMGAYIGVVFGATQSHYLSRVVLVDGGIALPLPAGMTPEIALEKVLGPALERLRREFESVDAYLEFWRAHPAFGDARDWSEHLETYFRYDLCGEAPRLRSRVAEDAVRTDGLDPMREDMLDMIDRVPNPMLLLTALRGLLNQPDPLMPLAAVRAKVDAIEHLEWQEIPDTNHYTITLGHPAPLTAAAIHNFLSA